jgi:predicted nucleic acid-binding Zn ribbon protein
MICKECEKETYVLFKAGECKGCFDKKPKQTIKDDDMPDERPAYKGKKRVCPVCLTSFKPKVKQQKFCKTECTMKASNKAKRKREEPNMVGLKVLMCSRCGKMFQQKHANERMCSDNCRITHKKKQVIIRRAKKKGKK